MIQTVYILRQKFKKTCENHDGALFCIKSPIFVNYINKKQDCIDRKQKISIFHWLVIHLSY